MSATEQKINHAIADWVGDIVALESHVEEAMDRQLKLTSKNADVTAAIKHFHDIVRDSKQRAVAYQGEVGTTAGNPVIKVGTNLLGKAAGLIDMVRRDSVAKSLRDDYTAYNLLAISYTMLHTTAMAMEDGETQAFAEKGLRTYAKLVQEVNHLIPLAVVEDLKDNSDQPLRNTNVVDGCRKLIDSVWKSTSK
jgi:hypothetical protein